MKQKPPLPAELAAVFERVEAGQRHNQNRVARMLAILEAWIHSPHGRSAPLSLLAELDQLQTHIRKARETRMLIRKEAAAFYDLQEDDHQNPA